MTPLLPAPATDANVISCPKPRVMPRVDCAITWRTPVQLRAALSAVVRTHDLTVRQVLDAALAEHLARHFPAIATSHGITTKGVASIIASRS